MTPDEIIKRVEKQAETYEKLNWEADAKFANDIAALLSDWKAGLEGFADEDWWDTESPHTAQIYAAKLLQGVKDEA